MNLKDLAKQALGRRDIDANINQNIRRFRAKISDEAIRSAKRPQNWQNNIELIIPCYNHAPYLEASFASIVAQTRKEPLSLTFVNDASTDDSLQKMEQIKRTNTADWISIQIANNATNLNQGGSLNKVIAASPNDLFVLLNADDLLTPDCLQLIVDSYWLHPEIFLLGGSSLWFEGDSSLPKHKIKPASELGCKIYGPKEALHFTELNDLNMSQSSCSFFKVSWELVGGYFPLKKRVASHDDRDFQMRVSSVLPVGVYSDYPMEFYRTTSSTGRGII